MTSQKYLPFRGLSGWFSCSVNPTTVHLWDYYGGTLAGEDEAIYLFSDDASAKDTIRVYETQQDIALFQSTWIREVIQNSCTIHDIALGQHLLLPHYLAASRETGSPQPTSLHVEQGRTRSTDHENTWENSRESRVRDINRSCLSTDKVVTQTLATQPGGDYALSERASTMFAEYNAMWDELESRMSSTDVKDIADAVQVPCVNNAILADFVISQPQFKIRRV